MVSINVLLMSLALIMTSYYIPRANSLRIVVIPPDDDVEDDSSRRLQQDTGNTGGSTYLFDDIDLSEVSLCGCNSCFDRGFTGYVETRTGEASCAQRVMQLITDQEMSETEACRQIAVNSKEYSDECGPICDINRCDGRQQQPPLANAQEQEDDNSNSNAPPPKTFCGCQECTQDVWLAMAGEFSCGARVSWLVGRGQTAAEACSNVAGEEYADVCGPCNPDTCQPTTNSGGPTNVEWESTYVGAEAPITNGDYNSQNQPEREDIPLTPDFPLYCFPPASDRVRYENVWGKYTVEVKESENPCGPSDNIFSSRTVQLEDDELTLQFQKVGDQWEGSEVRVLLPWEEMPFHYGEYSFSVKSVQVIDSITGTVVDTVLPITLILGLFTWDSTESYAIHENYNHEVDIEISRWDIEGLSDVQYLVQPPGDPHKYRFFSGEGETYSQGNHTYSFDWRPAEIEWGSSAGGGGHNFIYSTQDALDANAPDYVQCLPADVEVRLNLWNLFGDSAPKGMEDTHRVEVVIDKFEFTPSGLTGLPKGGVCSRSCQCEEHAVCLSNRCVSHDSTFSGGSAFEHSSEQTGNSEHSSSSSTVNSSDGSKGTDNDSQSLETEVDECSHSGLGKAGKAFLVLFLLTLLTGVGCFIYALRKRKDKHRTRIELFVDGDGDKKSVECWDDTEKSNQESSILGAIAKSISGGSTS